MSGKEEEEGKLKLGSTWTLWYDRGGARGQSQAEYEQGVTEVGTIATVEDFWRYWDPLARALPDRCNLLLFKRGIRPTWEDPENAAGGRYTLTAPRAAAEPVATGVVLEVIGEQLPWPDRICGVVVRVRPAAHTVDVWTRAANEPAIVAATCAHVAKVVASLGLAPAVAAAVAPVRFQTHRESAAVASPSVAAVRSPRLVASAEQQQQQQPPLSPRRAPMQQRSQRRAASSGGTLSPSPSRGDADTAAATATAPQQQQKKQTATVQVQARRSKDDSHLTAASAPPSELQQQQQQSLPPWMCHKKSASEDVRGTAMMMRGAHQQQQQQQGHVRRVSGIEVAVPVLLRQGFDVPTAAYEELAQLQMHATTPQDSPRAAHCQQLLRTRGSAAGPGFKLPPGYMQHRRAYSLDRSAEDLNQAYDTYHRAKHEALLADFRLETGITLGTPAKPSQQQQPQQQPPGLMQLAGLDGAAAEQAAPPAIPGIVLNEQVSPVGMMMMATATSYHRRKQSESQPAGVQRSALSCEATTTPPQQPAETLSDPAIVASSSAQQPHDSKKKKESKPQRDDGGVLSSALAVVVLLLLVLFLAIAVPALLLFAKNR